jgi:hypothetical protein
LDQAPQMLHHSRHVLQKIAASGQEHFQT